MGDCWAITQKKGRRCGDCKGDCNFIEIKPRRGSRRDRRKTLITLAMLGAIMGQPPIELPERDDD